MEMLSKIRDAVSMMWEAFDEREREIAIYVAVYLGSMFVSTYVRAKGHDRERREAERLHQIAALVQHRMKAETDAR